MRNQTESKLRMIMRTTNCYLCRCGIKYNEGIRKPKIEGGDVFIWCKICYKKTFIKKKALLRR